ncbi:Duplicated homeodomain-like superfamily protein [Striga hermonthica]|uniref:Duplicated homeodomain-like superfamily protein n=1 Tax=Striga hermonthica TaxID=68872 RepID=A0A9N7NDA4_STRHE|nr:Duplicated homeodomain-like superfamily protein [Striga hermonthica]
MEFLDEFETRPRFLLQSKHPARPESVHNSSPSPSSFLASLHRPTIAVSLAVSAAAFTLLLLRLNFEPYKSLLLWVSLSLLLGPFAPPRLTAGDIRVGLGPPLEEIPDVPPPASESDERPISRKSSRSQRKSPPETSPDLQKSTAIRVDPAEKSRIRHDKPDENKSGEDDEENDWDETDEELLRKMMAKHPVGMPGRWEAIAEGFKGKHKVETVIAKAKETGSRKSGDRDSYEKFLKARKPVDKRVLDEGIGNLTGTQNGGEWTSAEDLALLNALKAFPKDVGMRWEKIAASVPGKTKSDCMKRVTMLKKDFRSSKGSSSEAS